MLPESTPRVCRVCQSPIPVGTHASRRFCSPECRQTHYRKASGRPDDWPSTATVGAMQELLVCADLMRRGWHVFRAMSPACPADIVAYKDGDDPIRIQVRTAKTYPNGTPV